MKKGVERHGNFHDVPRSNYTIYSTLLCYLSPFFFFLASVCCGDVHDEVLQKGTGGVFSRQSVSHSLTCSLVKQQTGDDRSHGG